jgi:predicted HD superfamily hydrolase involved in NAD metabolism
MNDSVSELEQLRACVESRLSPKRFEHTLGVERAAVILGGLFMPDKVYEISFAALLHDIAKEISKDEQLELIQSSGYELTADDLNSPAVLHSYAAPGLIKRDFPKYATENILSAVYNHTVGCVEMTVFDKIIFISDFIEDTRTYPDCIAARAMLLGDIEEKDMQQRMYLLNKTCLFAVNSTLGSLKRRGMTVNPKTIAVKNYLEREILQK